MEKEAVLIAGVTEPHPLENIVFMRLIATHRKHGDMLGVV
jgi:hypothetical protein